MQFDSPLFDQVSHGGPDVARSKHATWFMAYPFFIMESILMEWWSSHDIDVQSIFYT